MDASSGTPYSSSDPTTSTNATPTLIETYRHKPLGIIRNEIRLLKVTAIADGIPLCTLIHVALGADDAPEYEALSYRWGLNLAESSIIVDGRPFQIRRNLFNFLTSAHGHRLAASATYIWVDQICIDQRTTNERNHQVELMAAIYLKASKVLIWLGRADQNIEAQLAQHHRSTITPDSRVLNLLTHNLYWNRLWVQQEVFLGLEVLVIWGSAQVSWPQLLRLSNYIPRNHIVSLLARARETKAWSHPGYTSIFHGVIATHCHLACADTRDKVYGLQMLIHPDQRLMVDYSRTADEVFAATVVHMFNLHDSTAVSITNTGSNYDRIYFRFNGCTITLPSLPKDHNDAYHQVHKSCDQLVLCITRLAKEMRLDGQMQNGEAAVKICELVNGLHSRAKKHFWPAQLVRYLLDVCLYGIGGVDLQIQHLVYLKTFPWDVPARIFKIGPEVLRKEGGLQAERTKWEDLCDQQIREKQSGQQPSSSMPSPPQEKPIPMSTSLPTSSSSPAPTPPPPPPPSSTPPPSAPPAPASTTASAAPSNINLPPYPPPSTQQTSSKSSQSRKNSRSQRKPPALGLWPFVLSPRKSS